MTPSWYDLLAVDEGASADEIRAAWRDAVADLDPTDRRFAVLNRAAKVLLDPERRAEYDAELAARSDEEDAEDEGVDDEPEAAVAVPPVVAPAAKASTTKTTPAKKTPAKKTPAKKASAQKTPAKKSPAKESSTTKTPATPTPATTTIDLTKPTDEPAATTAPEPRRVSLLLALLAGVLSLAFVVIAVVAWTTSRDESQVEEGITDARSAAEAAVVPVLSYDATDLEAGRSAATSYLTDDFAEDYDELFAGLIEGSAPEIGARVETTFVSSAVVRSTTDGARVQVLVFFDQSVTNDLEAQPRVNSNQATLTMAEVGDEWLVDDIDTGATG